MNASEYTPTKHAIYRSSQRFGVRKEGATNWLRQKLQDSSYVSAIIDKGGKERNLYACKGALLVVDDLKKTIITVMTPKNQTSVNVKLRKFATQELTKVRRKETHSLRKIERLRAEIECEMGDVRLRLLRARSLPTKIAIQARMKALKMRLNELPAEEFEVRRDKTRTATALAKVL